MRPATALALPACALLLAAAGCGGRGDAGRSTATAAPAARVPSDPPGATLADALATVPTSRAARTALRGVALVPATSLATGSPGVREAVNALLGRAGRRAAAASGTAFVVRTAAGARATTARDDLPAARRPVTDERGITLVQQCLGAPAAELVLGPDDPGLAADGTAGAAVVADRGRTQVVVCSVPRYGVDAGAAQAPVARGLRRAGLAVDGVVQETEDDDSERFAVAARMAPAAGALRLVEDPAALRAVVRGR